MYQALQTKYLGPTKTKGARVKAFTDGCSVSIPYRGSLSSESAHILAIEALLKKLKDVEAWGLEVSDLVVGSIGNGYVFVYDDQSK